jgi:hypothetical protein
MMQDRIGGAALSDAAAKLGASETNHIAQNPQQRHVVRDVDFMGIAVDPSA